MHERERWQMIIEAVRKKPVVTVRELVVAKTRYIVPYRVRGETVEILRVFHTSRRLPDRWGLNRAPPRLTPAGRRIPTPCTAPPSQRFERAEGTSSQHVKGSVLHPATVRCKMERPVTLEWPENCPSVASNIQRLRSPIPRPS